MPVTLALVIGFDSWLIESQRTQWRSAGYFVTRANPTQEAVECFNGDDFDLILLDMAIPAGVRWSLIWSIRSSGSAIPAVSLAELPFDDNGAWSRGPENKNALHRLLGELVAHSRRPPAPVRPLVGTSKARFIVEIP